MTPAMISIVQNASDTATRDVSIERIIRAIRNGDKTLRPKVETIRRKFSRMLSQTSDRKAAKRAIDSDKKKLPGVTWSGRFKERHKNALIEHSGLLGVDLDSLGDNLPEVRKKLEASPYVVAVFLSPSGDGLKVVFRVPANASKHAGSFRAAEKHVRDLTEINIDQACKDPARLCFMSYDPELYVNDEAVEIIPLPEPEKPKEPLPNAAINLSERQRIAEEVAAKYGSKTIWISESAGYLEPCPGQQLHTTGDGDRNCKIDLDRVPTTHCFHDHCRAILEAINRELRSRIGEAERAEAAGTPQPAGCADADVALPRPYVPPPLDLLPEVLQKFIRVGAKATDVDRAFIFLPVLSETAACIGISRSIRLKESYVEPSIVWTSNIAPTGDGKTPGMRTAIRLQLLYEMKLKQENEKNAKEHETELAKWESDTQSEAR